MDVLLITSYIMELGKNIWGNAPNVELVDIQRIS